MDISDHKSYNLGENKIESKPLFTLKSRMKLIKGQNVPFFILNLGEVEGLKGNLKILFFPWLQTWTE